MDVISIIDIHPGTPFGQEHRTPGLHAFLQYLCFLRWVWHCKQCRLNKSSQKANWNIQKSIKVKLEFITSTCQILMLYICLSTPKYQLASGFTVSCTESKGVQSQSRYMTYGKYCITYTAWLQRGTSKSAVYYKCYYTGNWTVCSSSYIQTSRRAQMIWNSSGETLCLCPSLSVMSVGTNRYTSLLKTQLLRLISFSLWNIQNSLVQLLGHCKIFSRFLVLPHLYAYNCGRLASSIG